MAVKTITITEDAYARLAAQKHPGESFSGVISRMSGKHSLLELAGILSPQEADELEKHIAQGRKAIRRRMERIAKELR